jgi:hypothetical protein
VIETDCAILLKVIECKDGRWSRWVGIIAEIKEASQLLSECKFMHAKREGNQLAHSLAKHATLYQQSMILC